jgi:hypothetical protein
MLEDLRILDSLVLRCTSERLPAEIKRTDSVRFLSVRRNIFFNRKFLWKLALNSTGLNFPRSVKVTAERDQHEIDSHAARAVVIT